MKAIQNFVSIDNKTTPYVVVFVHGYNEHGYSVWFPLWNYIQDANIRAAFVRLDYRGSIRTNAADLTEQLKEIVTYYGVDDVIVVCHSKGGLDIQGAIYYYNVDTLLRYVVTLSTPHWGTPLCDLIDSDLSMFKNIQKQAKNPATDDMKVTNMAKFRRLFDNDTRCSSVKFYTIASNGTEHNERVLLDVAQKQFMNYFGKNDDTVHVRSASKPRAIPIATIPCSHSEILNPNNSWNILKPYLLGTPPIEGKTTPSDYNVAFTTFDIYLAIVRAALYIVFVFYAKITYPILAVLLLGIISFIFFMRKRSKKRYQ